MTQIFTPPAMLLRRLALGLSRETVAVIAGLRRDKIKNAETAKAPDVDANHARAIEELEAWSEEVLDDLVAKIAEVAERYAIGGRPVFFTMGDETYEHFGSWKGECRALPELYRVAVAEAYASARSKRLEPIAGELLAEPYRQWLRENNETDGYQNRVVWWLSYANAKGWSQ